MDWKEWHRELSDILGCEYLERTVTLEKARELVARLAQYQSQSIPRTADVPADATQWIKYYDDRLGRYRCTWARQRGLFVDIFAAAPDYRPDTDAACLLPVIDV